jgi:hypothetical protein
MMEGCKADVTLRDPTYTLSGTVNDIDFLTPIVGAKVSIGDKQDMTDFSGHYQIGDLASGRYDLSFSKGGFVTYTTQIEMFEADKTFDAALTGPSTYCHGHVVHRDHGYVVGCTVRLTSKVNPALYYTQVSFYPSHSSWNFYFGANAEPDVRKGTYVISFCHPSYYPYSAEVEVSTNNLGTFNIEPR